MKISLLYLLNKIVKKKIHKKINGKNKGYVEIHSIVILPVGFGSNEEQVNQSFLECTELFISVLINYRLPEKDLMQN